MRAERFGLTYGFGLPPIADASRIKRAWVDLMTLAGVVGVASIWPERIGVLGGIDGLLRKKSSGRGLTYR